MSSTLLDLQAKLSALDVERHELEQKIKKVTAETVEPRITGTKWKLRCAERTIAGCTLAANERDLPEHFVKYVSGGHYHYSFKLEVDGKEVYVYANDGLLTITLDSKEQLLEFIKKYGLEVSFEPVEREISSLLSKINYMEDVVNFIKLGVKA